MGLADRLGYECRSEQDEDAQERSHEEIAERSTLPSMNRRKNKTRIPRSAVNPGWLGSEHGKKYDSPKYIAEDDEFADDENAGVDEGAEPEAASGESSEEE